VKKRYFAGPVLVNGAYVTEISGFVLILQFLPVSLAQQEWLFAIYSIVLCITLPIAGLVADKSGSRFAFRLGSAIFVTSSLLMTISGRFEWLFISRCTQGIGAGFFSPMIPILLSPKGKDNARNLAVWGTFSNLFSASAPLIILAIMALSSWVTAWLLIPMLAFIGLTLGSQNIQHKPQPLKFTRLNTSVLFILSAIFFNFGVNTLFIFSLPYMNTDIATTARLLTLMWVTAALISFGISYRLSMRNYWWFISQGSVLNLLGIFCLLNDQSLIGAACSGCGFALTNAPTTYGLLNHTQPSQRGLISALDIVTARLGGALFVLLITVGK